MNATPATPATPTLTSSTIYTCEGRDTCGIAHRSYAAARRCCSRHERADRYVMSSTGVFVSASSVNVGRHFGCCGVLKARNGRTVWSGEVRPYGFDSAALADARQAAESRGWQIRD